MLNKNLFYRSLFLKRCSQIFHFAKAGNHNQSQPSWMLPSKIKVYCFLFFYSLDREKRYGPIDSLLLSMETDLPELSSFVFISSCSLELLMRGARSRWCHLVEGVLLFFLLLTSCNRLARKKTAIFVAAGVLGLSCRFFSLCVSTENVTYGVMRVTCGLILIVREKCGNI